MFKNQYNLNLVDEKEAVKWYVGLKVKMVKLDKDGNIYEEAHPGFTSNPTIC